MEGETEAQVVLAVGKPMSQVEVLISLSREAMNWYSFHPFLAPFFTRWMSPLTVEESL